MVRGISMGDFGWVDYTAFITLLVGSTLIGIFASKNQPSSAMEFITAGGKMNSFLVALSMLASFLSSVTLLGQPAEAYLYGSQIWLLGLIAFVMVPVVGNIMVPFFREKNYFCGYQYFGERFSKGTQLIASTIFTIQMVIYLGTVLYAPALAMDHLTGLGTIPIVTVMYIVCVFYTSIGGIKGVVWTDAFQVAVIFISLLLILYQGTINIGGVSVVWERNKEFNRTSLINFNFDMTERYTFWSTLFGTSIYYISSYGANQLHFQRYQAVTSCKTAIRMLWINAFGWLSIISLCTYFGLLIFATYYNCDPLISHKISRPDLLFPLYISETLQIPGFQGLFQCALFGASLSTVSTGVNSMAAIWFAELEGTVTKKYFSHLGSGLFIKLLTIGFGVISYSTVFVIPYMGGLVQLVISLGSSISGSLMGIFMLGFYFPKSNSTGAIIGLLTSTIFLSWIAAGYNISQKRGLRVHVPLPSSVRGCSNSSKHVSNSVSEKEEAFVLYRISYNWYGAIAFLTTIVVGILASYMFKGQRGGHQKIKVQANEDLLLSDCKEPKLVKINPQMD